MDRRAREGRAQRRHRARHGKHRPGARGRRDRRDVWDRRTFPFSSLSRQPALDRARGMDDRATRAVPALGANSTDRARPSKPAGWTSPREDDHPRVAHRPTHGTSRRLEIRRVVGNACAVLSGGTNTSDPHREIPNPRGTRARPPRRLSSRNPPGHLPARPFASRRVASRRTRATPARPRAPRQPPFQFRRDALLSPLDGRAARFEIESKPKPRLFSRGFSHHPSAAEPDPAQHHFVRSPRKPHLFHPKTLTTHHSSPFTTTGPPR